MALSLENIHVQTRSNGSSILKRSAGILQVHIQCSRNQKKEQEYFDAYSYHGSYSRNRSLRYWCTRCPIVSGCIHLLMVTIQFLAYSWSREAFKHLEQLLGLPFSGWWI